MLEYRARQTASRHRPPSSISAPKGSPAKGAHKVGARPQRQHPQRCAARLRRCASRAGSGGGPVRRCKQPVGHLRTCAREAGGWRRGRRQDARPTAGQSMPQGAGAPEIDWRAMAAVWHGIALHGMPRLPAGRPTANGVMQLAYGTRQWLAGKTETHLVYCTVATDSHNGICAPVNRLHVGTRGG